MDGNGPSGVSTAVVGAVCSCVLVLGAASAQQTSSSTENRAFDKRNIRVLCDGRPVELSELHEGDRLTATNITQQPATVLREQEVTATIAASSVP